MIEKNKKIKVFLIALSTIIILVLGTVTGLYLYSKIKLEGITKVDIPSEPKNLGIDSTKVPTNTDITNILLMGIDSRDPKNDSGHSDSLMILTVDKKHNKLKITSIMRDSLVNIKGHSQQRITNAHQFGGALLTLKTVNENYEMDIMNYIQVNFFGLEKMIDAVGGVEVDITADEIPFANNYIDETATIDKTTPIHITKPGVQTLNGSQAVGYCRIRYVGNSDFKRTERQRIVLTSLFKKLSITNKTDIPKVADIITPYIETSLKSDEIMSLVTYVLYNGLTTPLQSRVPYDGFYNDAVVNGAAVLTWDKDPTIKKLHEFIFEATD